MNHDDGDVGNVLIAAPFYLTTVVHTVVVFPEKRDAGLVFGMILTPSLQTVDTQIVFIILNELLKAAFGNDRQFMVRVGRTLSITISFHDVLLPGTCCLLHLISSAVMPPVQEMVNEIESNIIDTLRLLINLQRLITPRFLLIFFHIP
jgi:hypothetical protein